MFSNTVEKRPQPNPAFAEKPLPAPLLCHVAPVGISILLYLGSVALIAAGTLGVSLGTGFYLLVHPAQEMAAGYAKRDRGSGVTRREDSIAGASPLDDQTAPILGEAEIPRSAVTVPSPAAGPAQGPAVQEAAAPDKSAAPEPVPASSVGEVPATTASAASPSDELLALLSTASGPTIAALGRSEAVPAPVRSGVTAGEIDQTAQPTEAAETLDRPVPDEEALGSPQAVGRVTAQDFMVDANTKAVRIEPPSMPWNEVGPDEIAGVRRGPPEGQASEPSNPTTPEPELSAVIRGIVTDVPNVATWVVLGRTVRLSGIDPGPPNLLASLVNWVRAKGPVECLPQSRTGRYRCFTATGEDIAEAALLAGVGRAGDRATAAYRNAESRARRKGKGLWAGR